MPVNRYSLVLLGFDIFSDHPLGDATTPGGRGVNQQTGSNWPP